MKQFYIDKKTKLTELYLAKILAEFNTLQGPELKHRYNYYIGNQAIIYKKDKNFGKPSNRIVTNFIKTTVDTFEGYALGNPVMYHSTSEGFEELMSILRYNDYNDEDATFFRQGLIYGRAAEICYIDEDSKTRFKVVPATNVIPVYDTSLNGELLYAIRFWEEEVVDKNTSVCYVEVYDREEKKLYKSAPGFMSVAYVSSEPHHFNQVPVTFFSLNDEEESVCLQVFSLQDAYNTLYSDAIDDWESFCDAYLVLKGLTADEETIKTIKDDRVLMLPADSASAEYLIKNTSVTEIQNLLAKTEEKIREITACPNFASESFGTSSGTAIKFRTMNLENATASMLSNFKKALQKRTELLSEIIKLVNGEELWRDIEISFRRNLPVDETAKYQTINSLRGLVSDASLLTQVPFITNVDDEMAKKAAEKELANNGTYSSIFNMIGAEINEEE